VIALDLASGDVDHARYAEKLFAESHIWPLVRAH
jgi:hypothetical protein